jgi:hypothetical protein
MPIYRFAVMSDPGKPGGTGRMGELPNVGVWRQLLGCLSAGLLAGCHPTDRSTSAVPGRDWITTIVQVRAADPLTGDRYWGSLLVGPKTRPDYSVSLPKGVDLREQDGRGGHVIAFSALHAGQRIRVRTTGSVEETFPARVVATQVTVLKDEP